MRVFLSQPGAAGVERAGVEPGRVSSPLLGLAGTLDRPTFYLVGSGAMIKEVKAGLVAAGIDRKRQIRNEAFFG
jgi:ferredoxin-NADP reductase